MSVRVGAILQRVCLVLGGVLVGLMLLEGTLQVASLLTRGSRGAEVEALFGAGQRVVCLGDSNTYGLFVKRPEAYPQLLQQVLAAGVGPDAMQVVNLGAPGLNSSRVRARLDEVLRKLRPDVILLMVGANDLWTAAAPIDDEAPADWSYLLWRHSRVFRWIYMQRRVFQPDEFEVKYTPGVAAVARGGNEEIDLSWTGRTQDAQGWQERLHQNLAAISATARQAGIDLILLTYPSDRMAYGRANTIIRAVAQQSDVPLLDVANVFSRACPTGECPELFYRDQHPTARGYQLVAAILWQFLTATTTASR